MGNSAEGEKREIERLLMLKTAELTALAMHRTGVKVVKFSTIIRSQLQVKSRESELLWGV